MTLPHPILNFGKAPSLQWKEASEALPLERASIHSLSKREGHKLTQSQFGSIPKTNIDPKLLQSLKNFFVFLP